MHCISIHCPWQDGGALERKVIAIVGSKHPYVRSYGPGYTRMIWRFVTPAKAFEVYARLSPLRTTSELMMWKGGNHSNIDSIE